MRNATRSVGAGSLLPVTGTVKQNHGKSFRASRQPKTTDAPAKPPRPIPPPPDIPPECCQPEPETFTLQLIRPVGLPPVEEKRGTVSMHQSFDAPPPGCAPEHVLTVRLEPGEPYELLLNGVVAERANGGGWQDRQRSILTIRAARSAGFVGSFTPIGVHEPADGRNAHPILMVPVSASHAVFMEVDGRELVNLPAPQREGGQH